MPRTQVIGEQLDDDDVGLQNEIDSVHEQILDIQNNFNIVNNEINNINTELQNINISVSKNIDGGFSNSLYLQNQSIDGGNADG